MEVFIFFISFFIVMRFRGFGEYKFMNKTPKIQGIKFGKKETNREALRSYR